MNPTYPETPFEGSNPDVTEAAPDHVSHDPGKTSDIIAKVQLIRVRPNGERLPLTANVCSPYKTLDGFWRTTLLLEGFNEEVPEIYGVDSLQSLFLAIDKVHVALAALVEQGDRLLDEEGRDFLFDRYFRTA